ncbi:LNS2 domain-containing protein [Rhodococcus wratislaviensis]
MRRPEVIESGFDLAWAIERLGFTLVYLTTRPDYTHTGTRRWLTEHDLPTGRALTVQTTR